MVYVAADLKLKESAQRDQELIQNWNSIIQDDDWVLLTGIITASKEATSIKKVFDQMKGNKRIMDMNFRNPNEYERFKFITGHKPYCVGGFINANINGEEITVVLPVNREQLKKEKERKNYCAAAGSLLEQNDIFENKCLDISIDRWGYIPILYTDIPILINNLLTYDEELRRK